MKLKSVVAAIAMVMSGAAFAANVNHVVPGSLGDGDTFGSFDVVNSGALVTYSFTLAGLSNLDGIYGTFNSGFGVPVSLSGNPTISGAASAIDNYSSYGQFHFTNLAAGNYMLTFGTNNGGGANWSKNGTFITFAQVTAVPEPETYAMMLAGLGAVGFMARRRKSR